MIPDSSSKDNPEDDVRYGIAGCRQRLRSRRATHRAQKQIQTGVVPEQPDRCAPRVESYAELLATVSMSQASLSRLVDCLLDRPEAETTAEREEALIT